jgi:TrpR family trp operon transcriptional repressor
MNSKGWTKFTKWCLATEHQTMLSLLFDLILTQEEKESIATRCLIISELIKEEKTQRDIAKDLKVSISKISRGSNELKRISTTLMRFLQTYENDEKILESRKE